MYSVTFEDRIKDLDEKLKVRDKAISNKERAIDSIVDRIGKVNAQIESLEHKKRILESQKQAEQSRLYLHREARNKINALKVWYIKEEEAKRGKQEDHS